MNIKQNFAAWWCVLLQRVTMAIFDDYMMLTFSLSNNKLR